MQIPLVDLKSQYNSIKDEIDGALQQVISEAAFIWGKYCLKFENEFAGYCGSKYCIGVGNGTDALLIALKALGIGTGDEVITVANTFVATSEAIVSVGAEVVFVDCDPIYYTIDTSKIEKRITDKTKAIIPVHLYGQPAHMVEINTLAKKYNLYIIEDAAQAHGAKYKGQTVGTLGDIACFSFYPGKNLGAYGDGGAIVTNNKDLADTCRILSDHGRLEKYIHEVHGYNSRLDGLQAAILSIKLQYLDRWNQERKRVVEYYFKNLSLDQVILPQKMEDVDHVYHLFVVQVKNREALIDFLKINGISTGIHYPIPLPHQKAYRYLEYKSGDFPISEKLSQRILSLPIYPELTNEQLDYIISKIKIFYNFA